MRIAAWRVSANLIYVCLVDSQDSPVKHLSAMRSPSLQSPRAYKRRCYTSFCSRRVSLKRRMRSGGAIRLAIPDWSSSDWGGASVVYGKKVDDSTTTKKAAFPVGVELFWWQCPSISLCKVTTIQKWRLVSLASVAPLLTLSSSMIVGSEICWQGIAWLVFCSYTVYGIRSNYQVLVRNPSFHILSRVHMCSLIASFSSSLFRHASFKPDQGASSFWNLESLHSSQPLAFINSNESKFDQRDKAQGTRQLPFLCQNNSESFLTTAKDIKTKFVCLSHFSSCWALLAWLSNNKPPPLFTSSCTMAQTSPKTPCSRRRSGVLTANVRTKCLCKEPNLRQKLYLNNFM